MIKNDTKENFTKITELYQEYIEIDERAARAYAKRRAIALLRRLL